MALLCSRQRILHRLCPCSPTFYLFPCKDEDTEIHVGAALRDMKLQKAHLRVTPPTAIYLSKKKDGTIHVREGNVLQQYNNACIFLEIYMYICSVQLA